MESNTESAQSSYKAGVEAYNADKLEAARGHFAEAVRLDPNYAVAHARLGQVLLDMGFFEEGAQHRNRAFELAPDDQDIAISHAAYLELSYKTAEAEGIVNRLLAEGKESSKVARVFAASARRNKCQAQAVALIDRVLAGTTKPAPREEAILQYQAADLLDSLGRYDEAFERATRGVQLRPAKYDPAGQERVVRMFMQYFTKDTFRRLPHATHGSELPVFVVGMPRSGTTLVEQIIASHRSAHGGGELRWMFRTSDALARRFPENSRGLEYCYDHLTVKDVDDLAAQYLQPLQALNPAAQRIVDKMPTNFMLLGMIQLLLPASKVIYCRRDPLDTCLSCYLIDFQRGNDFTYSLPWLGHYFRQHEILMNHWKSVLTLPILEVEYEKVVQDVEGQARRIIDFVNLPWDDNCLKFYEYKRFVNTASTAQVRQPIYNKSVGRWRNYERHLEPLRQALWPKPAATLPATPAAASPRPGLLSRGKTTR